MASWRLPEALGSWMSPGGPWSEDETAAAILEATVARLILDSVRRDPRREASTGLDLEKHCRRRDRQLEQT